MLDFTEHNSSTQQKVCVVFVHHSQGWNLHIYQEVALKPSKKLPVEKLSAISGMSTVAKTQFKLMLLTSNSSISKKYFF